MDEGTMNITVGDLAEKLRETRVGSMLTKEEAIDLSVSIYPYINGLCNDSYMAGINSAWRHAEKEMK